MPPSIVQAVAKLNLERLFEEASVLVRLLPSRLHAQDTMRRDLRHTASAPIYRPSLGSLRELARTLICLSFVGLRRETVTVPSSSESAG